ncbi:hypothetical protein HK405_012148, partial [Cladochytrium tenue]
TSGPAAQAAIRMAVNTCRAAAGIVDDAQVAALRVLYMWVQDEPPPAIEGLVLHHDGLQCALCKYCTPLRKSQRKHAQLMHREANILHAQPGARLAWDHMIALINLGYKGTKFGTWAII